MRAATERDRPRDRDRQVRSCPVCRCMEHEVAGAAPQPTTMPAPTGRA